MSLPLPALAMPTAVSDAEFRRFQRLILDQAGIHLGETKRAMLAGRLAKRLRELGLATYSAYFDRVLAEPAERMRMLDLIVTNETSFFREPAQFEFLVERLVPYWREQAARGQRGPTLRIWSAGCATGEEPFSLAMLLQERLDGWRIEIVASDLSTTALERAREAVWPIAKASAIPEALLRKYMLRGIADRAGFIKADDELRAMVTFRRLNLHEELPPGHGRFDAVFCRNVLIYFEAEARRRAIARLVDACTVGGLLFVGHAETLQGTDRVAPLQPTIWRRVA